MLTRVPHRVIRRMGPYKLNRPGAIGVASPRCARQLRERLDLNCSAAEEVLARLAQRRTASRPWPVVRQDRIYGQTAMDVCFSSCTSGCRLSEDRTNPGSSRPGCRRGSTAGYGLGTCALMAPRHLRSGILTSPTRIGHQPHACDPSGPIGSGVASQESLRRVRRNHWRMNPLVFETSAVIGMDCVAGHLWVTGLDPGKVSAHLTSRPPRRQSGEGEANYCRFATHWRCEPRTGLCIGINLDRDGRLDKRPNVYVRVSGTFIQGHGDYRVAWRAAIQFIANLGGRVQRELLTRVDLAADLVGHPGPVRQHVIDPLLRAYGEDRLRPRATERNPGKRLPGVVDLHFCQGGGDCVCIYDKLRSFETGQFGLPVYLRWVGVPCQASVRYEYRLHRRFLRLLNLNTVDQLDTHLGRSTLVNAACSPRRFSIRRRTRPPRGRTIELDPVFVAITACFRAWARSEEAVLRLYPPRQFAPCTPQVSRVVCHKDVVNILPPRSTRVLISELTRLRASHRRS